MSRANNMSLLQLLQTYRSLDGSGTCRLRVVHFGINPQAREWKSLLQLLQAWRLLKNRPARSNDLKI